MAKHCDRLREALNMRGITQSVLSYKTKIPESSISHYLKGDYEPKRDRMYKMATALHVSEAWLKGFDVPINEESAEQLSQPSIVAEDEYVVFHRNGARVKVKFNEQQKKIFEALVDTAETEDITS